MQKPVFRSVLSRLVQAIETYSGTSKHARTAFTCVPYGTCKMSRFQWTLTTGSALTSVEETLVFGACATYEFKSKLVYRIPFAFLCVDT